MTTQKCRHCQDPIPASRLSLSQGADFCCNGCAIAFEIINENNGDFYELCDLSNSTANTAINDLAFCTAYDSDAFREHYTQELDNGSHVVTWYVQGAHCAACVWLLERLSAYNPGVISSRLHIGKQQLITAFNPTQTTPKEIATSLAKLGYTIYPWHSSEHQQQAVKDQRNLFVRFAIACGAMAGCMHVSWNILAGEYTLDLDEGSRQLFALMAAILSIPAITYCAWPWYQSAWRSLKQKRMHIDLSISSIIVLGSLISFVHLALGRSDLYFDAMCMFICFLLGGRVVLHIARQHVGHEQDALKQLLPLFVTKQNDGSDRSIRLDDIRVGDQLCIPAGERLPVDGYVRNQRIVIDNALLSGEDLPIEHIKDDLIHAGAKIIDQDALVTAASTYHQSRLAGLMNSADQNQKQHKQSLSDRLLNWFTPVVSLLGLITWLIWYQVDLGHAWNQAIAVFIVACPCALGIAAPLAQAVFMRQAAQRGLLMSNSESLEQWSQIKHVVFDKTGTLTEGKLQVQDIHVHKHEFSDVLPYILAACRQSQHPIAVALTQHYSKQAAAHKKQTVEINAIPQGIACDTPHGHLIIRKAQNIDSDASGFNHSDILLDNELLAVCSFQDQTRTELLPFINNLRESGKKLWICSGDHQSSVQRVGRSLGFADCDVHGDQSPEDKQAFISSLQTQAPVLMIGDGVNDALALQTASISIGVRGGLEAAMRHSDIYVSRQVNENLPLLWPLIAAYRSCLRSCLSISLIYNIVGVTAAMLGLWGPLICAIAMPLSSLSVILVAWFWPFPSAQAVYASKQKPAQQWTQNTATGVSS